jgi:Tat protein secretion system quality control protein TatD with DNase activity
MTKSHTPTPWKVGDKYHADIYQQIPSGQGSRIASCMAYLTGNEAYNAAHIVHCVNAHDELVAALQDVSQTLAWVGHGECRGFSDRLLKTEQALEKARAALEKATK